MHIVPRLASTLFLIALLLAACGDDDDSTKPSGKSDAGDAGGATKDGGGGSHAECAVTLKPSDDDQSALQGALIDAEPGDTICLASGTFKLKGQLTLATEHVTVRGKSDTILDFSGQKSGANGIELSADHDTLDTFQIVDPKGDGIRATQVDYPTVRRVRVSWSGEPKATNGGYGVYPVTSSHVLIEDCYVKGASDTGIYVGQSEQIVIRNNEVEGNVAGIEIENSTDAEVYGNHSHGNTGGILVFNLPNLSVKDGKRANVHDNQIEDNNLANFAAAGNIVADVPRGTGLFILCSDDNEIHDNTIKNHDSIGVGVFSWHIVLRNNEGKKDPDFNWYPERNYVHDNKFENNGKSPQDSAAMIGGLVGLEKLNEMLWDGEVDPIEFTGGGDAGADDDAGAAVAPEGVRNCFNHNGDATFVNFDWAGKGANKSTDVTPYECTRPALPKIEL
jgi:parallel beta-helix repeat protein